MSSSPHLIDSPAAKLPYPNSLILLAAAELRVQIVYDNVHDGAVQRG
jgi:hypothetical protein